MDKNSCRNHKACNNDALRTPRGVIHFRTAYNSSHFKFKVTENSFSNVRAYLRLNKKTGFVVGKRQQSFNSRQESCLFKGVQYKSVKLNPQVLVRISN